MILWVISAQSISLSFSQDARTPSNDEAKFGATNFINVYRILMIFMPICSPFQGLLNDKKIVKIR